MNRSAAFRLWAALAALLALGTACPGTPAPKAESLDSLFAAFAAKRTVYSKFTERRWFSFRKEPVELQGELRLDPLRGMSLRYIAPEERLMILDAKGILLRDARGRERTIPADPRAAAMERALLAVLRFDRAEIEASFAASVSTDESGWKLTLIPKNPDLAKTLGTLSMEGNARKVRRLEFRRSESQRVSIDITESREGLEFTADESRRFFR